MPELPEVETIKRQLQKAISGKEVTDIEVLREKSFQGDKTKIIHKTIQQVDRRAKIIIISFRQTSIKLLIHLKMTGQLIYQSSKIKDQKENRIVGGHPTLDWINDLPGKHTRVIIRFKDNSQLYFNDQRVFGWLKTIDDKQLDKELATVKGIEPLTWQFTFKNLTKIFSVSKRPVKLVLLDQDKIAGIGNIYACDGLYKAQIHPQKPASQLTVLQIKKLRLAINSVIRLGIKYGGASENTYRQLDGLGGQYQDHFLVYNQADKACPKCNTLIKKIKLGGRGTYFCPVCQK